MCFIYSFWISWCLIRAYRSFLLRLYASVGREIFMLLILQHWCLLQKRKIRSQQKIVIFLASHTEDSVLKWHAVHRQCFFVFFFIVSWQSKKISKPPADRLEFYGVFFFLLFYLYWKLQAKRSFTQELSKGKMVFCLFVFY